MCKTMEIKDMLPRNQILRVLKISSLYLLSFLIVQAHRLFDLIIDFLFGLYYNGKVRKVPPVKNDLLLDSAVTLAEKIRHKKVTAEEVVRAFVERCKEVNGIINAVVEECYNDAVAEAREVDKLLEGGADPDTLLKSKPFLGVPFTTKESNMAKGLLHTMGLVCRRDHRSVEDSTVVASFKEAGGILVGKTNIPELNLWCESRNNLYGQTNNPYNTTRTVGGSSGGDAAIVAACGVPLSIGSDIGGSIRMPAFFNGLFGHKPTGGLSPMKGVGLRTEEYPDSMAEAGPICRKAKDLDPFLRVLLGDKVSKLHLDEHVNMKELKLFYQEESGDIRSSKVNWAMRAAMRKCVHHFDRVADSVTEVNLPGSEYSYRLWRYWMTKEKMDFKYNLTNGKMQISAKSEIIKLMTGKSELTLAAILKLVDEDFFPKEDSEWAESTTTALREYLLAKLCDNGVLLYTSSPSPASYHCSSFLRPYNFGYWCIFNVLRFPTCQVPLGLDENGLPIGIQVVATPYNDHLCLAVARELEAAFGGWVPPS